MIELFKIILGYWFGKIFGWVYIFYLLAFLGGMLQSDGGNLISNLSLFLAAAIFPFVIFSILSIIIKKIKPGPDNLSIEIKIMTIFAIFALLFIVFGFLGQFF